MQGFIDPCGKCTRETTVICGSCRIRLSAETLANVQLTAKGRELAAQVGFDLTLLHAGREGVRAALAVADGDDEHGAERLERSGRMWLAATSRERVATAAAWEATSGRPYTIALDFDGTVYAGPWTAADECTGGATADAVAYMRDELSRGSHFIIHTCRLTAPYEGCPFPEDSHRDPVKTAAALRAWFERVGLTAAEVGRLEFWTRPGKPWAHVYIDDRAVRYDGGFPWRARETPP